MPGTGFDVIRVFKSFSLSFTTSTCFLRFRGEVLPTIVAPVAEIQGLACCVPDRAILGAFGFEQVPCTLGGLVSRCRGRRE